MGSIYSIFTMPYLSANLREVGSSVARRCFCPVLANVFADPNDGKIFLEFQVPYKEGR